MDYGAAAARYVGVFMAIAISAKAERADPGQPASSRRACHISAGSGAALIFARRLPGNPAARYNARTLKVP
jgi:hypothetical protein